MEVVEVGQSRTGQPEQEVAMRGDGLAQCRAPGGGEFVEQSGQPLGHRAAAEGTRDGFVVGELAEQQPP